MFDKETVFVVGAGASHEFDLPLGPGLIDKIRDALVSEIDAGSGPILEAFGRSNVPDANLNIRSRASAFVRGLHGMASIDQYLHFHKDEAANVMLGKCAISFVILNEEMGSKLKEANLSVDLSTLSSTWLVKLFHMLNAGMHRGNIRDIFKNISIVCFNYDRCIEIGLYAGVRSLVQDHELAAEVMNSLSIWHPYGTVGDVPYKYQATFVPKIGFPYANLDSPEVLSGAKRLRTFTEEMNDEVALKDIRLALKHAKQIIYLGFSFQEQNMKLITSASADPDTKIYATTFKLGTPAIEKALLAMANANVPIGGDAKEKRRLIEAYSARASDLLVNYGPIIHS